MIDTDFYRAYNSREYGFKYFTRSLGFPGMEEMYMESLTKNRQSKELLEKMIERAVGERVHIGENENDTKIVELTEGYYNVAYEVIHGDTSMILKITPAKNAKIMTYEQNIMEAEVMAMQKIKKETRVPVPEIIFYDNKHDLCEVDYFFMEKLNGKSLSFARKEGMPDEEYEKVTTQLGAYCRELNEVKGNKFGYFASTIGDSDNYRDSFLKMIQSVLKDGEAIDISIGYSYDRMYQLIEDASRELTGIVTPCFVHWDLWDGNVFIKDGKIEGLIDFERAMWAEPLMEYYFRGHTAENNKFFLQGFGENLRERYPVRANLCDLYLYLIMVIETKYRCYPDDNQLQFSKREIKNALDRLQELGYYL